jgi:serine/threonine protein kinase
LVEETDVAKVIAIGQPVNDAERIAIAQLRDHLPDSFTVLHNFRIDRRGESFEIDIALLAPHALYVIDVKGTRGLVDVHGPKWYPEGRSPFPSPLAKLQSHAKAIKGIITASHPGRHELESVHVAAAILLTAPDAHLVDPADLDARGVVKLKDAERYFKDTTLVPTGRNKAIGGLHSLISGALHLKAKPATGRPKYGHWQVLERLGSSSTYTESRAQNVFAGGTARVRLYKADPYQSEDQRKAEMHRIANAYRALSALPMHANIVAARDFFEVEDDQAYVLVLDDAAGQALTVHMARPQLALTVDQKWRVAKDLLAALVHAHRHGVVHRNLTPSALIVGPDGTTRVTDFDYARPSADRSATIAGDIVDLVDVAYVAPEAYREPGAATAASDIFSAGLILFELLTGEKPFNGNPQTVFDTNGRFPTPASLIAAGLTPMADTWLQSLCDFEPGKRPTAEQALAALAQLLAPAPPISPVEAAASPANVREPEPSLTDVNPRNLPQGFQLTRKFLVDRKLGQGTFGVVYKVIDTLGDVARVIKLVVSDRHSPLDRLKREYGHLVKVPDHPNVVKVLDADVLPWGHGEQIPYMVFEYIEGSDVGEMIQQRLLAPEDALELGKQVADGLLHLHSHGFHHCDIKPRNLLWTTKGAKIIDFNVSVRADDREARGGGSRRYLPPDFDAESVPQNGERADRDLYALALTLYEAVTGHYPWNTSEPPSNQPAPDPRQLSGFDDLAPELVNVMLRGIAPKRADRWHSALDLKQALSNVHHARRMVVRSIPLLAVSTAAATGMPALTPAAPNTNPFVAHLLSLYSQSARSNAGTRGMDAWGDAVYVATDLDHKLLPAVLAGEFRLVLITGNAGDGKTAFLQHLEREVEKRGGTVNRNLPNGSSLELGQRRLLINYDGSQDEGSKPNDQVLREFMAPFSGRNSTAWAPTDLRLIAINEGRLVDFLASYEADFPALKQLVQTGLATGEASGGIAVVNLNLRSVVAPAEEGSILERTIKRMTAPAHWLACEQCDLKDSCYALHNARSFQDETAGPRLIERLQTLYTMTHLRGKLHITMRDLRSALSFMLISNRDCADIHATYAESDRMAIVRGFYFNSWLGAGQRTADRLISLLAEVDVGRQEDPRFDRGLDFIQPDDRMLFRFDRRAEFDFKVLQTLFEDLPRGTGVGTIKNRARLHREYVAMTRRKQFFERRDGTWERMLPYRSAKRMVDFVRGNERLDHLIPQLLNAINRGEGLQRPERLGQNLALQLRHVENGTVRSYRLFPSHQFSLQVEDFASQARFVEHLPTGLRLRFRPDGKQAMASDLVLNLDVFEMLTRLNEGYRPSVEEMQGYYLSLAVFKNSLNAQPYREILLTTTGHDFYQVARRDDGVIEMQLSNNQREAA